MKRWLSLIGIVAALPVWAWADEVQTPGSQIEVTHCAPVWHPAYTTTYRAHGKVQRVWHPAGSGQFEISFINRAHQPAVNVQFGLIAGDRTFATVDDAGTFSPGKPIHTEFKETSHIPTSPLPPACVVLAVRYADGSGWSPGL